MDQLKFKVFAIRIILLILWTALDSNIASVLFGNELPQPTENHSIENILQEEYTVNDTSSGTTEPWKSPNLITTIVITTPSEIEIKENEQTEMQLIMNQTYSNSNVSEKDLLKSDKSDVISTSENSFNRQDLQVTLIGPPNLSQLIDEFISETEFNESVNSESVSNKQDNFSIQSKDLTSFTVIQKQSDGLTEIPQTTTAVYINDTTAIFATNEQTTNSKMTTTETNVKPIEPTNHVIIAHIIKKTNEEIIEKANLSEQNLNTYKDKCSRYPVIQACNQLRNSTGLSNTKVWYYNPIEMNCQFTSDCILNENFFQTKEECEGTCEHSSGPARCLAPPRSGYYQCALRQTNRNILPIMMVYFDKTSGKCLWFTYFGCGGNQNRFRSIEECEQTCGTSVASKIILVADELCQVAPNKKLLSQWPNRIDSNQAGKQSNGIILKNVPTPTDYLFDNLKLSHVAHIEDDCPNLGQYESRWYLDVRTYECHEFAYSHCGGSSNNFLTKTDCEQFCSAKVPNFLSICKQPPLHGDCTHFRPMWYYDPDWIEFPNKLNSIIVGGCRQFNYSGCGGNSNRFATKNACKIFCQNVTEQETYFIRRGHENNTELSQVKKVNLENISAIENGELSLNTSLNPHPASNNTTKHLNSPFELLGIDFEPCRREPVFGNCKPLNCLAAEALNQTCEYLKLQRWFFNLHTSNCETFVYSGCGGSENTFDDAQSCQASCKARIVRPDRDRRCDSNPHQTKCYTLSVSGIQDTFSQSNYQIAYHFSIESATCKAFHLNVERSECSPKYYFANGHECLKACVKSTPTEKHLQNRCFARKTHTFWKCSNESEKIYRWSYLSELNQCIRFSQCSNMLLNTVEQPGNNFASRGACETTCMSKTFEEVCQLPKDPGPCNAYQTRYYYDVNLLKCKVFLYGGCLGNANRFLTRKECLSACEQYPLRLNIETLKNKTNDLLFVSHTNGSLVSSQTADPPTLSAHVFERMRQITQHHTDHYPWDICLDDHNYGTCPNSEQSLHIYNEYRFVPLIRYFYDRRLGQCHPYSYTGCGSQGNHFDTYQKCQEVCENRLRNPKFARCQTKQAIPHCPGSGIRVWAFNYSIGDCNSFEICTNNNEISLNEQGSLSPSSLVNTLSLPMWTHSFRLRRTCQYHCLPKPPKGTDSQNICHMNPIVTVPYGCNAMVTRWYFEPRGAHCRSYITCPQYGNNFLNEKTCQEICSPSDPLDVCRLPKDNGGCSQFVKRWYYDQLTRTCLPFSYGGCFGNSNRFLTKAECDGFCTARDVCRLPLQKYSTEQTYPERFYFNQTTQQCSSFRFTGLLPHGNHFLTMADCNATCLYVPDIDVIGDTRGHQSSIDERTENGRELIRIKQSEKLGESTIEGNDTFNSHNISVSQDTNFNNFNQMEPLIKSDSLLYSPCALFVRDSGIDLDKQTICDPEDIIHELGYRFRVININLQGNKQADQSNQYGGICEPILVPICLTEPKLIQGEFEQFKLNKVGRIFKTQQECETKCLLKRRLRRSVILQSNYLAPGSNMKDNFKLLFNYIKEFIQVPESWNPQLAKRNGCKPGSHIAEGIENFAHKFQVLTRWPCQTDTSNDHLLEPLIETFEDQPATLNCWIISSIEPEVSWTHIINELNIQIEPSKYLFGNLWVANLTLQHVQFGLHDGAWICKARNTQTKQYSEAMSTLHIMSHITDKWSRNWKGSSSTSDSTLDNIIRLTIPEGGTILLRCPFDETKDIHWTKIGSKQTHWSTLRLNSFNNILLIPTAEKTVHAGEWFCRIDTKVQKFHLHIGLPPKLKEISRENQQPSMPKHKHIHLKCDISNYGYPTGQIKWFRCLVQVSQVQKSTVDKDYNCIQIRNAYNASLTIIPLNNEQIKCRIENIWGRGEQNFPTFPSSNLYQMHV